MEKQEFVNLGARATQGECFTWRSVWEVLATHQTKLLFFFILNVLLDKKQIVHLSCSLNFCWVCYIVMLEVDLKSRFYQVTRAAREELSRSHSRIFLWHPGCPR